MSEQILVIDTSYGLTVGVVGHEPHHEADSRQHVEKIEPAIAASLIDAGLTPADIAAVVVGIGPAPFTGLRAGIVSAKAFAFATGARLLGQNILEPQAVWSAHVAASADDEASASQRLVLAVNDARRKQLYSQIFLVTPGEAGTRPTIEALSAMDIQDPAAISNALRETIERRSLEGIPLDILGHGAEKYAAAWETLPGSTPTIRDQSVIHAAGTEGLGLFARLALDHEKAGDSVSAEPLYLRRPDVSIPAPLKPVTEAGKASR